jgi:hypothetical protein
MTNSSGSALPILPQSVSRGARLSGLPDSRICYGLPSCSLPCTDRTDTLGLESFYFQASNGSVALPVAGYDYNSDWTSLSAGLHPLEWQLTLLHLSRTCEFPRIRLSAQPRTGDLCHEAPAHAVTRTSRSSATGSIDNSPGGFLLH